MRSSFRLLLDGTYRTVGPVASSLGGRAHVHRLPYYMGTRPNEMKDMARKATAKKFKLEAKAAPSKPKAPLVTRITEDECIVKGEVLTHGREFQIEGSRDRFTFLSVQFPETGEPWVNAKDKKNASRAFHLDRIRKVVPLPRPRKGTVEA